MAIKYGGYLSKDVKTAMEKSRDEIIKQENVLGLNDVDKILSKQLQLAVSSENIMPVSRSMGDLFEAIEGVVKYLEMCNQMKWLVEYGTALGGLMLNITQKIDKWGCFSKWSEEFKIDIPKPPDSGSNVYYYALPAPKITRSFWELNELNRQVDRRLRKCNLYFMKTFVYNSRPTVSHATIVGNMWITNKKYSRFGKYQHLDWVSVQATSHNIDFRDSWSGKYHDVKLSNSEFISLMSATLGDFFDYSVRVNREFATTDSLINQLKNQQKAG